MYQKSQTTKKLLLIGGGHSHAIVLRSHINNPLPNINLSLISENLETPYSGMLPGHIAGFYTHDECHINLQHLTNLAGAKFYINRVINLDLNNNRVFCENLPPIDFDILSIDIGSIPASLTVTGAEEYAIAAKPVKRLLAEWEKLCNEIQDYQSSVRIGIVGGGAGGVELALAMQAKLTNERELEIHLYNRDRNLMSSYDYSIQKLMKKVLLRRNIKLHLGETVSKLEKKSKQGNIDKINLTCESGLSLECDRIFWVTQASAPQWLTTTGLTTDKKGFILINNKLQSVSHPHIFASGDIATMVNHPHPKAGVFAVRQGKPLFNNLRRYIFGETLKSYIPQRDYLSLIGTGDGKAVANRGNFTLPPSRLLWFWKDWIDRKFMQQFK
ncbi:FAD-dependent oxidoreductase [Brunnivagina elsteri]|uniref:FAD-dependent oxidoreductase n=1 Tax=Brunnivagina elsteri CCALA 953 TaxID=987040 RepID=A0A2A2TMC8_9CYAN|nr:FAD-dependent oxidoreductase [Calothrix elsteri]PAX59583.1 FAD-dependent oxidoreductase [Calothrix elsteri CCALA 953]